MKTAMQQAIKEIAELWSSPSDTPTYTQIFKVLESKLDKEKEQIKDAFFSGCQSERQLKPRVKCWEDFYNETFKN